MSSTVKNGISLWIVNIEDVVIEGIRTKKITSYPALCDCGYTRPIGGDGGQVASYFYHHYYYLCEGCGKMLIGDEEENGS